MTTPNFTSLLTALRAFVLKSRPAYRDYLGTESVEEKTVLLTGTLSATGESVTAADGFTGFTNGQTYKATIGDETVEVTAQYGTGSFSGCIVIGSSNVAPSDTIPGWMVCVYSGNLLGYGTGEWTGKPVEVFTEKTVKVDRWDVKKLPEECLPDVAAKKKDIAKQAVALEEYVDSRSFTFTITPVDGQVSPNLSATRAEMLAALDAGKTLLGYWTETRTILDTTDTIKHEFRLESVSGTGADRGLAFVNYEQFYKSTLYVNGNDTVSFVDKEQLPNPMTKTEAMTQSVGMDNDGRLWTEPGASGDDGCQTLIVSIRANIFAELTSSSIDTFDISFPDNVTTLEQAQAFTAKIDNALSASKQIIIKDSSNNTYTPHRVERGKNNDYFLSFMVVKGATLFMFVLLKNAGNMYFSMNNLFKYSLTTISA